MLGTVVLSSAGKEFADVWCHSTASGQGVFSLDAGNMLSFDVTIRGLHSSETGASIHGLAVAGANAGILCALPLGNTQTGRLGPLTPAQVADLEAGLSSSARRIPGPR